MLREDLSSETRAVDATGTSAAVTASSDPLLLSLATWLESLQALLPSARCHAILLGDETGAMSVAAVRPPGASFELAREVANDALHSRETRMRPLAAPGAAGAPEYAIAHPVIVRGQVRGATITILPAPDQIALGTASSITRWGVGWLVSMLLEREIQPLDELLRRTRALHDLVLTTLVASDFDECHSEDDAAWYGA